MHLTGGSAAGRLLLIGYGNPGRGDDGLGPALAEAVGALGLDGVTVEIDYQLTVDHAALIACHAAVVFADAAMGLDEGFRLTRIGTAPASSLGSHQVTPEAAMHLASILFDASPPGWVLALGGRDFGEVKEGLSAPARANLQRATRFMRLWIAQAARCAVPFPRAETAFPPTGQR